MTDLTPLSPAAQAVQGAAIDAYWLFHPGQAAAILRAAADQLGEELEFYNECVVSVSDLLAIAAELESAQ